MNIRRLKTLPLRAWLKGHRLLRANLRRKFRDRVSFSINGMKCGTTALDSYLRQHPQIEMADIKEPHFFTSANFKHGYDWYHAWFAPRDRQLMGDATPSCIYSVDALRRMYEYNPAMRIIVLLRNPVDRTYSEWNHFYNRRSGGIETLPFWDALHGPLLRRPPDPSLPAPVSIRTYVECSRYLMLLERLWGIFPREQTLPLKSEAFWSTPQATLDQVIDFLGVQPFRFAAPADEGIGSYQTPMSERERDFLHETFDADTRKLEALLGWDCSDWLE